MKSRGAGRRRARLAALGAAVGALWLLGSRADVETLKEQLTALLSRQELAQALLEESLPGGREEEAPSAGSILMTARSASSSPPT